MVKPRNRVALLSTPLPIVWQNMLRKQAAKSSKEKSTTSPSTASSRSTTAARLADYTGAQSAPLAGYGITTVPGLYQTMSQSPGSPGLEGGATGGFSAAAVDTTDDIAAGVSDLAFHQEKKEKVRISCVMQMTSVVRWLYGGRNMPSVRFLRSLLTYYFAGYFMAIFRKKTACCLKETRAPPSECLSSYRENHPRLWHQKALSASPKS